MQRMSPPSSQSTWTETAMPVPLAECKTSILAPVLDRCVRAQAEFGFDTVDDDAAGLGRIAGRMNLSSRLQMANSLNAS